MGLAAARDATPSLRREWRSIAYPLALLALCATLFFWRLGVTPLDDFDESYYAEGAREMVERGDLWIPYFNGEPFLLKPVLVFWLNAAAFRVLGTTEFAARAPSALFATMTVLVVYWFASLTLGRRTGLLAGVALALSYLWIDSAREGMTDMPLTAALTCAMFLLFLAGRAPPNRQGRLYLACYPLLGVALLAKGPTATAAALAGFVGYLIAGGRLRPVLREARLLPGMGLMLAVAAPWYTHASIRHPEFLHVFFVREHIGHLQGELARHEAWWGHLKNVLIGFYPWAAFLPAALARAFAQHGRNHVLRFAGWWTVAVVGLCSLAGAKLPHYLLPGFPAMALLVGAWLNSWTDRAHMSRAWTATAFGMIAAVGIALAYGAVQALDIPPAVTERIVAQYGDWSPGAGLPTVLAALAAGSLGAVVAAAVGRRAAVAPVLAGAVAAAATAYVGWFKPRIAQIQAQPRKELAQLASTALPDAEPLGVFYAKRPATVFYARRPIVDLGEEEPRTLAVFLSSPSPAAALTHARCLPVLQDSVRNLHIWGRRGDFMLVSNRRLDLQGEPG